MPATLILRLVAGLFSLGLGYWLYIQAGNHFQSVANVRQKLVNTEQLLFESQLEFKTYKETEELRNSIDTEIAKIRAETTQAIAEARKVTDKYRNVIENRKRMEDLARRNPDALTRLTNAAVKKRHEDLANIFNN